jgi:hypothetical protein
MNINPAFTARGFRRVWFLSAVFEAGKLPLVAAANAAK